jgi:transposase
MDQQQIIDWYVKDGFSINYIAKNLLHCRASTISKILKENNIVIKKGATKKVNINQEKEIIELYTKEHYTQKELAEKFHRSTDTIHKILIKNSVAIISQPKINKNQIDTYFDIIDTEEKAYWLGFIFADGNIFNNQLTIEIHERDRELLERFKIALNLNGKISHRVRKNTSVCSVRVVSKHLCETLSKYGIVPNKTYVTKHLPQVPETMLPHFLRGLIDGDGWISTDKSGHYHIGFVSHFPSVCEDFKRYCNILTDGKCRAAITRKDKNYSGYCFQIQSKEATKLIATILYKDNTICLSRKYRRVEPLLD